MGVPIRIEPLPSDVITSVVQGPLPTGSCSCLFKDGVRVAEEEKEAYGESNPGWGEGGSEGESDNQHCSCRFVFNLRSAVATPKVIDYMQ